MLKTKPFDKTVALLITLALALPGPAISKLPVTK